MSPSNIMRRPHGGGGGSQVRTPNERYALVICGSPVNRVVVCRILQDCGIRPVALDVSAAMELMRTSVPKLIVMGACHDPEALQPLLDNLTQLSALSSAPPTIYLAANRDGALPDYPFGAVARMPVSMDTFRPLVERFLEI